MEVILNLNAYVTPPSTMMERKWVKSSYELQFLVRQLKVLAGTFHLKGKRN